jgi:ATP-binding cassette subfamily B protein
MTPSSLRERQHNPAARSSGCRSLEQLSEGRKYIFSTTELFRLDFADRRQVRSALSKEIKNSTAIIVAQRVSTVMNARSNIGARQRRYGGNGHHREAYASCEVYREIVFSQLSQEEIRP